MTVTVPLVGIIVLIFILHTILTHLSSWAFRECKDPGLVVLVVFVTIIELVVCVALLTSYIP
jgi:hypothetical protein